MASYKVLSKVSAAKEIEAVDHKPADFIRGLQHPEWDLTPGTGVVQR